MRQRYIFCLSVLSVLFGDVASAQPARGQNPGVAAGGVLGAPGLAIPVAPAQPGEFTINDIARIMGAQSTEYFSRQREDRDFFVRTMQDLERSLVNLETKIVNEELDQASLAQRMSVTAAWSTEEFLRRRTAYMNAKAAVEARIATIVGMTSGALPSQNQVAITPSQTVQLPGFLVMDLQKIATEKRAKLAELEARVNGMQFSVLDKSGATAPHRFTGLNPDTSSWILLSPQDRANLERQKAQLERQSILLQESQDKLTQALMKQADSFLDTFGVSERGRISQDPTYQKRRNDTFAEIRETLWMRDYARMKYGLPQGVVPITYKKQMLNMDAFLRNPREFIDFLRDDKGQLQLPVRNQDQMGRIIDGYVSNIRLADWRNVSIHDGSASGLSRMLSLLNQIRGFEQLSLSAKMVFEALKVDVEQDLALERGGHDLVRASYRARYYANDQIYAETKRLECIYEKDDDFRQQLGCTGASPMYARQAGAVSTFFFDVMDKSDSQLDNAMLALRVRQQLAEGTRRNSNAARRQLLEGMSGMGGPQPGPAAPPRGPSVPPTE